MGTDVHLLLVGGPPAALDRARSRILDLERRWSRFSDRSELSRLNAAAGRPVVVSPETVALVSAAVEAWRWTSGLFDPTTLAALVSAGYDRTFELMPVDDPDPALTPAEVPGCGQVVVSPEARLVLLPPGVAIDAGGIAKGLAADWLAEELVDQAAGACVNIGGDVRVAGEPPTDDGWVVSVDHPGRAGRELVRLVLAGGAVCTSSRARRRWRRAGSELHHLIDPRTARPALTQLVGATVVAGSARVAEVLCKVAMVGGRGPAAPLFASCRASAVLVHEDGRVDHLGDLERFAA